MEFMNAYKHLEKLCGDLKNYFFQKKRKACKKTRVFSHALFNYTIASINFFPFM